MSRYPIKDANLCENAHRQDHHPRGGELGHDRERQGEDPRQGGIKNISNI